MPPPSYCSKISTRSTGDHEPDIDANTKTDLSSSSDCSSDEESKGNEARYDGVGIVKSLLGPSFEDAVLKTFEFGKSLIQKVDENDYNSIGSKKLLQKSVKPKKAVTPSSSHRLCTTEEITNSNNSQKSVQVKKINDGRFTRKRIVFTAKHDKEPPPPSYKPPSNYFQRLSQVSKIRSLDSDLKQLAPSPEKIKRQLEALIQINKDEPPERAGLHFFPPKTPKFHSQITVMPSLYLSKNDIDIVPTSSGERQQIQKTTEVRQASSSKIRSTDRVCKKKTEGGQSGICQAPEFLTSALGPTLDVSIIDNLKMMRSLFRCDGGRCEMPTNLTMSAQPFCTESDNTLANAGGGGGGGGGVGGGAGGGGAESVGADANDNIVNTEFAALPGETLESRFAELKQRVEELEEKEQCLMKKIEEEEKERDCKRKAFEEEEKKLCNMKACLEGLVEEEKRKNTEEEAEAEKYESLKKKVACEEEKLCRLKDQQDCYKREIYEAKNRREALKRNKSLLDAWDVIASKACHTRLPSFSRAPDLERKQLKVGDNVGNLHCCFMPQVIPTGNEGDGSRRGSRANSEISCNKEQISNANKEEPPFPIQRDVVCGLHKTLKPCCCANASRGENVMYTSDDDLLKMHGPVSARARNVSRSRSETLSCHDKKKNAATKIVKVLWAVTRINIFQDNCKTYEVMDATSTPPPCTPVRTEGIFVVKSGDKKGQQKRRCGQQH